MRLKSMAGLGLTVMVSGMIAIAMVEPTDRHARTSLAQQSLEPPLQTLPYPTCEHRDTSRLLTRTELFFGLSKPKGSEVTEAEFQQFLAETVTPRFPDGLTLLSGQGQFKAADGSLIQEKSKLLILLYIPNPDRHRAIEEIQNAYKDTFQQESVLRVDDQTCVSF